MADSIINLDQGGIVSLPGAGQTQVYGIAPDIIIEFAFDTANAVFSSNGNDLIITVEGSGTIVFEDYLLLAKTNSLPVFELLGGEEVPGDVFLFAFNEENENAQSVETAAGVGITGSGVGVYLDDQGNLFRSLDSLVPSLTRMVRPASPTVTTQNCTIPRQVTPHPLLAEGPFPLRNTRVPTLSSMTRTYYLSSRTLIRAQSLRSQTSLFRTVRLFR